MAARALLLDLDRTLVDLQSYTDYAAALADVRALMGDWLPADVPETDWDRPTMACMSVLHSLIGDPRWDEMSAAIAVHERTAIPQSVVMPTVPDALAALRELPTAVVTLLAAELVPEVLAAHGIGVGPQREVDVVVGRAWDVRPKPEPDGLLAACSALEVAPADAVMIGDSSWDAQSAERAGIRFIGVPSSPGGLVGSTETVPDFAAAVAKALRD
ncbi:MAG: HAD hydrolase-like protein [Actinomycetales bacterium]|nr:HAD hydrolase-like protein [Actinomycetales bacterium]